TNALFAIEVGPSYVSEDYFNTVTSKLVTNIATGVVSTNVIHHDNRHNYIGLRIGQRGEYKFKSGAKVWESVSWIPQITKFSNYLVNLEAGVSAPISKALSVSLVLQDTYNNAPPPGTQNNDFKLIGGLTYNF